MKISLAALALLVLSATAFAQTDGDDRWRCGRFDMTGQGALTTYRIIGKDGVDYPLIGYFDIDGQAVRNLRLSLFGMMSVGDYYCVAGTERRMSEREVELKPIKIKRAR